MNNYTLLFMVVLCASVSMAYGDSLRGASYYGRGRNDERDAYGLEEVCIDLSGKYGKQTYEISDELLEWIVDEGASKGACRDRDVKILSTRYEDNLYELQTFCIHMDPYYNDDYEWYELDAPEPTSDWLLDINGVTEGPCSYDDDLDLGPLMYLSYVDTRYYDTYYRYWYGDRWYRNWRHRYWWDRHWGDNDKNKKDGGRRDDHGHHHYHYYYPDHGGGGKPKSKRNDTNYDDWSNNHWGGEGGHEGSGENWDWSGGNNHWGGEGDHEGSGENWGNQEQHQESKGQQEGGDAVVQEENQVKQQGGKAGK